MKNDLVFVSIISEDSSFYKVMEYMFKKYYEGVSVKIYTSMTELRESVITSKSDLILIDEIVTGGAIFEAISFIRQNRRETCSILYFGVDVHDMRSKALRRGANYFYEKPIDPRMILYDLKNNWISVEQNEYNATL